MQSNTRRRGDEVSALGMDGRNARTSASRRSGDGRGDSRGHSGNPYAREAGVERYAEQSRRQRRGRAVRKAVAIGIPALVLFVIVVGVASAAGFLSSIGSRMNAGVDDATRATLASQQEAHKAIATASLTEDEAELPDSWEDTTPFYMLLLGVDKDENRTEGEASAEFGTSESSYRSDTIILARIDPGNKKVTLVSIHRDTWVNIDGTYMKINSAYALGGVSKVIEVVSDFAGVPIIHYAQVDMDGLAAIVDAMGGVTVDVPFDINDEEYTGTLSAGIQTLSGAEALIFTRSRHAYDDMGDGDRYRAANQRAFLAAMASQLLSSSPVTIVTAVNTLANYITTDLTVDQIASLALAMQGMDTTNDIYTTMNPTISTYTNGTWYELPDDEAWAQLMAIVDAGEEPPADDNILTNSHSTEETTTEETSAEANYAANIVVRGVDTSDMPSADVATQLQTAGFTNVTLGDQASGLTAGGYVDVVYLDTAQQATAEAVAAAIGENARAVDGNGVWNIVGDIMVVVGIE